MQLDQFSQLFHRQRLIHQLQQDLDTLTITNNDLKVQLEQITHERDHLLNLHKLDPIKMILQGNSEFNSSLIVEESHQTLEQRIALHEATIIELHQEINQLKNLLNHKDQQHLQIRKDFQDLKQTQTYLLNENHNLILENQSLTKIKNDLMNAIQQTNSKFQTLGAQINQAKTQLFQTVNSNNQELLCFQKSIQTLRDSWMRTANFIDNPEDFKKHQDSSKIQQLTEKLKVQSQIMEELGRQLDNRNDEIFQLNKNNRNNNLQSTPFDNYQHSINFMIRQAKKIEKNYIDLLRKYQEIAANYQLSIKQKQNIEEQYSKLKQSYENICSMEKQNLILKRQLKSVTEKLTFFEESTREIFKQCEELMLENDHYLALMQDIYGPQVYMERISQEKKKYLERERQRNSQNLWANTRELIEMNQKLKLKLLKKN